MVETPSTPDCPQEVQFFAFIDALSEESRRDIVADIVAHPLGLPFMKELEFTTDLHRATIHEHLSVLAEAGIIEIVEFPAGEQSRGQPNKFYAISESAREMFDRNDVFLENHWKELYDRVNKPTEIEEAESAPRPDH